MSTWGLQAGAIALGVVVLGFFVFASAYYFRNRRIALATRERLTDSTDETAGTAGTEEARPGESSEDPTGEKEWSG